MKRALTKNWGLKLLAFVFSVLLWIIVMNIEDPVAGIPAAYQLSEASEDSSAEESQSTLPYVQ